VEALCLIQVKRQVRRKKIINIHSIHLSVSTFLMVYPRFAFKKYTGTSTFPFRAPVLSDTELAGCDAMLAHFVYIIRKYRRTVT
jgi:hypothetical protein